MEVETINVFVDSDTSINSDPEAYTFRVSPPIEVGNDEFCEVYCQNFSVINGIYNIVRGKNNIISVIQGSAGVQQDIDVLDANEQGRYVSLTEIVGVVQSAFDNAIPRVHLSVTSDADSLKVNMQKTNTSDNIPITIVETPLANLLNFVPNVTLNSDDVLRSQFPIDLNADTHSIYVTVPEFVTNSRTQSSSYVASNTIAKIPIASSYGSYVLFQAQQPVMKFKLTNTQITNFSIKLYNEKLDLLTTGIFHATFTFVIKKKHLKHSAEQQAFEDMMRTHIPKGDRSLPVSTADYGFKTPKVSDLHLGEVRKNAWWKP